MSRHTTLYSHPTPAPQPAARPAATCNTPGRKERATDCMDGAMQHRLILCAPGYEVLHDIDLLLPDGVVHRRVAEPVLRSRTSVPTSKPNTDDGRAARLLTQRVALALALRMALAMDKPTPPWKGLRQAPHVRKPVRKDRTQKRSADELLRHDTVTR